MQVTIDRAPTFFPYLNSPKITKEEIENTLLNSSLFPGGVENGLLDAAYNELNNALREPHLYKMEGGRRTNWRGKGERTDSSRTIRTFYSDEETIKLQIYGKLALGMGRSKRVKSSHTIVARFDKRAGIGKVCLAVEKSSLVKIEAKRFITEKPSEWDDLSNEEIALQIKQMVLRPAPLLEKVKEKNIGCPLKELPRNIYSRIGESGTILEWEEPRFEGDLFMKRASLTDEEILQGYCSVAERVESLHKKLILHLDLQPGNLLFDEKHTLYLSDFDFTSEMCYEDQWPRERYFVWDSACSNGILLPTSDIFGLAISFATVILDKGKEEEERGIQYLSENFRFKSDKKFNEGLQLVKEKSIKRAKRAMAASCSAFHALPDREKSKIGFYLLQRLEQEETYAKQKEAIEQFRFSLTNEREKEIFNELQAELYLVDETTTLYIDAMNSDAKLIKYLTDNYELVSQFLIATERRIKKEFIEKLYGIFPFYPKFTQRLKDIGENYNKLKNNIPLFCVNLATSSAPPLSNSAPLFRERSSLNVQKHSYSQPEITLYQRKKWSENALTRPEQEMAMKRFASTPSLDLKQKDIDTEKSCFYSPTLEALVETIVSCFGSVRDHLD